MAAKNNNRTKTTQKSATQKPRRQPEKIIGLIALVVIACAGSAKVFGCSELDSNASATVSFLDVGQGDSILIQAEGKTVLIDGGERDQGSVVLDDLKQYGVTTIDYLIASHPHSDHIGGLIDVLNTAATTSDLTVSAVILPEIPDADVPTTRTYEAFLDGIDNNNITPTFLSEQETLTLGDHTTLQLIPPPAGNNYSSLNDYSLAAYLNCGGKTFLFTGDAEKDEEADWLKNGALRGIRADVFKAGHHGSRTSSSEALLELIKPTYVVISCGTDNSYGHPHEEALDRFQTYCDKIYRTDMDGTVICTVENGELHWSFDKGYAS